MDFDHTADRQMIADTLRRILADRYDFANRQRIAASAPGFDRALWSEFADLGLVGALFDEAQGGFGGTGFDILVVFDMLGRALVIEPFLAALVAGRLLDGAPNQIAALIEGSSLTVPALHEPQARYELLDPKLVARSTDDGWQLSGTKSAVPQASGADRFCLSACIAAGGAGEGELALFLVDAGTPGMSVRDYALIDGGWAGDLTFDRVAVPRTALVARGEVARQAIERASAAAVLALVAEAVGIMDVVRDTTIEYLRTRTQFGVPVGKFQALQHRMAVLFIEIEQARSAMINAAAAFERDDNASRMALSAAKFTIGRVGALVAEEAIQMHGGIGMTWELPLAHYAKRLIMIDHMFGDEDYHLNRYMALDEARAMQPA